MSQSLASRLYEYKDKCKDVEFRNVLGIGKSSFLLQSKKSDGPTKFDAVKSNLPSNAGPRQYQQF